MLRTDKSEKSDTPKKAAERSLEVCRPKSLALFLEAELTKRIERNARYSLRAFARDLGQSPSNLSEAMNAKHGLSHASIFAIAASLKLRRELTMYLCDLSDAEFSKDPSLRKHARKRLQEATRNPKTYEFDNDAFRSIADWHHLAFVALLDTKGFQSDIGWIAKRLGIKESLAIQTIERLERLGVITVDHERGITTSCHHSNVSDGVAPQAMLLFHQQVIQKALSALTEQSRDERYLSCLVLPVGTDARAEITEEILKFRQAVLAINSKYGQSTEVYALATQFFRLTAAVSD